MNKIQHLFLEYEKHCSATQNVKELFAGSGMQNIVAKLSMGFFPLGSGIFDENICNIQDAGINEGGLMIVGNDFGTIKYLLEDCKNNRENINNSTVRNLLSLGLDLKNTFFTNFYIGLRDTEVHPDMTMTHLSVGRTQEYHSFCYNFFVKQLNLINPKMVLCLGKEIGHALYPFHNELFKIFKSKSITLDSIYKSSNYIINTSKSELGNRNFMFIPHPSYAHINWKRNNLKEKIALALNEEFKS